MTLTISALSLNDLALSQPFVAHFDAAGGTIGRGEQNTLMLPDPERHISRQHARISAEGAGYRITNLSLSNVVTVAGRALSAGESAPIRHRDQVRIGGFLLEVSDSAVSPPVLAARTITEGRAAAQAASASAATGNSTRTGSIGSGQALPLRALGEPLVAGKPADDPFGTFGGPSPLTPLLAPPGDGADAPVASLGDGRKTPVGAAAAEAAPAASRDELWQAFCDAAGVQFDAPQGLSPELMAVIGQLLRAAVDGTVQLMAIGSATRHQLRAGMTLTPPRNDNPLEFSPDGHAALELLLQPPMPGVLPGPAAMTEAMHDLVGQSIGATAGMRAALDGVLGRFAPSLLESKLTGKSKIDSLIPMKRRSRLWELYLQHYETIRDEAQDDFPTLFGRAFLAACEQQAAATAAPPAARTPR